MQLERFVRMLGLILMLGLAGLAGGCGGTVSPTDQGQTNKAGPKIVRYPEKAARFRARSPGRDEKPGRQEGGRTPRAAVTFRRPPPADPVAAITANGPVVADMQGSGL